MIPSYWNAGEPPSHELLAAYLDGELKGPIRKRVADWLARHPQTAAEAEALREFGRAWHSTTPAEPSAAEWSGLLARIKKGALPVRSAARAAAPLPKPRRSWLRRFATLAAAAAVFAGILWLARTPIPSGVTVPPAS